MAIGTYHCSLHGRNGSAIWQQVATVSLFPGREFMGLHRTLWRQFLAQGADIRYSCFECGLDIEPGPHKGD